MVAHTNFVRHVCHLCVLFNISVYYLMPGFQQDITRWKERAFWKRNFDSGLEIKRYIVGDRCGLANHLTI